MTNSNPYGSRLMVSTRSLASGLVLAAAVAACGYPKSGEVPAPFTPAEASAAQHTVPDATKESLDNGRKLFAAKCNHCHGYPDVTAVEEGKWRSILERMGEKAELSAAERSDVLRFVLAARSRPSGR